MCRKLRPGPECRGHEGAVFDDVAENFDKHVEIHLVHDLQGHVHLNVMGGLNLKTASKYEFRFRIMSNRS